MKKTGLQSIEKVKNSLVKIYEEINNYIQWWARSWSSSGEIWRSVLALVLGKIEVLSACFLKVLEHVPSTES
jgi:hypothetical protein